MQQTWPAALAVCLGLALAAPAAAQDAETEVPDPNLSTLSTGTAVDAEGNPLGESYVTESHGDWQVRCIRTNAENDPCQLYQLLDDGQGGSVAEVSIFPLPDGGNAVAGGTIITPLETFLPEQITITIDGGAGRRYPYTFCSPRGCIARIGLTADDLANYRRGAAATIRLVPARAVDQEVILNLSLSGFTAGFAAVEPE
ncbi:MAG: invasion associated locus B family protein [Pseudomonadota bacterium]